MIVATAGHVDHGKTSLIRALTGTDTDRLPEEKKRGLSIDLGFAYLQTEGDPIGFIDVPGHEKFVRNMIAGVSTVDLALLVIAADDGPMPQTREHIAILELLGIKKALIVISKTDLVDPARVAAVTAEIEQLLKGTAFADSQVFSVAMHGSAAEGQGMGIEDLRKHLLCRSGELQRETAGGHFRLAIDRSFSVAGAGTVVTGTVFSGRVNTEDQVYLASGGQSIRVRGIHAQNTSATTATEGQRCALNISGSSLRNTDIERGDWIVGDQSLEPVRSLDVMLRLAPYTTQLKHWTPAHLHHGASDVACRIALLGETSLSEGGSGLARLICDRPVGAVQGDRLVLRDQSARNTIAGGIVIDPLPPTRGRSRPQRLAVLHAMHQPDAVSAAMRLLEIQPNGIELTEFSRQYNLTSIELAKLQQRIDAIALGRGAQARLVSPASWERIHTDISEALHGWHITNPQVLGASEFQIGRALPARIPIVLLTSGLESLQARGEIDKKGAVYHRSGWQIQMEAADRVVWDKLRPLIDSGGLVAPRVVELAQASELEAAEIEKLLNGVVACGLLYRVSRNRYYLSRHLRELGDIAETLAQQNELTVAAFRDRSGVGRNLAVEVLEYFDSCRLTRRVGETRQMLQPASEMFGD